MRRRLDAELIRRGLVSSREKAKQAVESGRVTVNGSVAQKAARLVLPGDAVNLLGSPPRFVSRGGEKLAGALAGFGLEVAGLWCCDVGASTGGFTDCLLQNGAVGVATVDVGRAQMHERLRADPRVFVYERTDVRGVDLDRIGAPFDLVTADLSFISLTTVLASLAGLAAPGTPMVVLVKPQFEVGRQQAARARGVIGDPRLWQAALDRVMAAATEVEAAPRAAMPSPLRGGQGNVEFFLLLEKSGAVGVVDTAEVVSLVDNQTGVEGQ